MSTDILYNEMFYTIFMFYHIEPMSHLEHPEEEAQRKELVALPSITGSKEDLLSRIAENQKGTNEAAQFESYEADSEEVDQWIQSQAQINTPTAVHLINIYKGDILMAYLDKVPATKEVLLALIHMNGAQDWQEGWNKKFQGLFDEDAAQAFKAEKDFWFVSAHQELFGDRLSPTTVEEIKREQNNLRAA